MNNKSLILVIFILVGGIILLGAGYFIGGALEKEKTSSQIKSLEKLAGTNSFLSSSKLVNSIIALGKVSNISDRTITLTTGTENLQVSIKQSAQIYSFTTPVSVEGKVSGAPEQKVVEFKDIKVNDNVSVNMKMLPDGQFEGVTVIIFPLNMDLPL